MNRRELNKDFIVFKSPISFTRDTPLILIRKIICFFTPYYFIHPIQLNPPTHPNPALTILNHPTNVQLAGSCNFQIRIHKILLAILRALEFKC